VVLSNAGFGLTRHTFSRNLFVTGCLPYFATNWSVRASLFLNMSEHTKKYAQFGIAIGIVVIALGYLAFTGVQESKSYYVTIKELREMNDSVYAKRLRVAGNVQPGSIKRQGTRVEFVLVEETRTLPVSYNGTEAPPDTFKDESQALAEGTFGRDGVFHAKKLQAKCASKYAPKQPGETPAANEPANSTASAAPGGNLSQ
jgi:cytochrome c-type biogenesis protein CcmE